MLANSRTRSASARGPYVPLAIAFVGLMISYRVYTDFASLDRTDLIIMFLFLFALMGLMGLQFFIVDRQRRE